MLIGRRESIRSRILAPAGIAIVAISGNLTFTQQSFGNLLGEIVLVLNAAPPDVGLL